MTDNFLDQAQDPTGRAIADVLALHPAPDWVVDASLESIKAGAATASRHYGDASRRLYPFHTKAACWVSCAFFAENRGRLPVEMALAVGDRLKKAASFHGISREFETIMARASDREQTVKRAAAAAPDSDFLWVDKSTGERRLPVTDAASVKSAESWLHRFRDTFTFADRCKLADRLMQKAAEFEVDLPEWVLKTAAMGMCSAKDARGLIGGRVAMLAGQGLDGIADEFRKMARAIADQPELAVDTRFLVKLAGLIDQADRIIEVEPEVKLAGRYAPNLPRPEDVLFAVNIKSAEAYVQATVPTVTGAVYDRDDLGRIKVADAAALLGTELAGEMSTNGIFLDPVKAAAVLRTLPRPDVKLFEQVAKAAGVDPVVTPDVGRRQLTEDEIDELASQYQPT